MQSLPPDRDQAVTLIKKLNATIVAKDHELAELDANISKLTNITNQDMKAIFVRGNAYEGTMIEINKIKYMLQTHVNRVIFKQKNKIVVAVKL